MYEAAGWSDTEIDKMQVSCGTEAGKILRLHCYITWTGTCSGLISKKLRY
jgi:hypothetical protein